MSLAPITIAIHTFGQDVLDDLVRDVRLGLTTRPRSLPPRWFYDDRGSDLFEAITELPEYYQTRTEAAILRRIAPEVLALVRPDTLVELGAGAAVKTQALIEAGVRDGLSCFLPFDISEPTLQQTARRLAGDYPSLRVYAMVGEFKRHLQSVPRYGRQLVVFLGGTIGNFDELERKEFLDRVGGLLQPGDAFLLGIDLVKDEADLVAAYDDAQGVTAEFNLNVLRVVNRELDADFDLEAFEHVAVFNRSRERIEMYLRSRRPQRVRIPGARLEVDFEQGEMLMTEISQKFTRASVERSLGASGLSLGEWYTDPDERFALCLCRSDRGP
ncbi:MAG: L-histidine N(alpha)-methyltransferase [Candidatus Nephthysia bennettiae]|uniref:L-histidine N(Alpha)-methyltransferase n=1 Tax=Candidatus Nephthysia bennettiae TaxID=3127016 RepID=A0A934KCB7_9BACT|nr:L-histidine N(alpha)-methyltransferase [Candidatus Dormibacteraeota bacterium]MBJ7610979.1 L-histidine N(alpha)-methyltransferase [Candidatus Dormibacteraeota bacterium]PZS00469.1 MAG: L-histidine N(alpha)-methyltransferase [Candidatus Dormibacteraeota bacterium]